MCTKRLTSGADVLKNLQKYLDEKYWTSIVALHWMAKFTEPAFKQLEFIPTKKQREAEFKCKMQTNIDSWMLLELDGVAQKQHADHHESPVAEK